MSSERKYDIVLFGATGFTGKLVATYLAGKTDESFKWAIAGRNKSKLERVKADLGLGEQVDLISADSSNYASLTAMSSQTRVVLTTVGPYVRYGEPLVKACVETATDYADITGEPEFVNQMIERYDAAAREKRIRIINCCGFDSIPHDLGAYMTAKALPSDQPVVIEGFVSARGKPSGGTWHSAIGAFARMREQRKQPKSLHSEGHDGRRVRALKIKVHYEEAIKGWAVPLPTIDPQVVLRSARALPIYGNDFRYGHYARIGSLPMLIGGRIGFGLLIALAQFKPTRNLLLKMRQPGEGPSEEVRAKSSFRVTFIGRVEGWAGNQRVVGEVSGGDPGYSETSKMLAESALCLALERTQLPEQYGVLTTAVAMGDLLLERLRKAGMKFEIMEKV